MEWVVFAGFALFIWWRLVKDDYRRDLEDELDEELGGDEAHTAEPNPAQPHTAEQPTAEQATDPPPTTPHPTNPRVQS